MTKYIIATPNSTQHKVGYGQALFSYANHKPKPSPTFSQLLYNQIPKLKNNFSTRPPSKKKVSDPKQNSVLSTTKNPIWCGTSPGNLVKYSSSYYNKVIKTPSYEQKLLFFVQLTFPSSLLTEYSITKFVMNIPICQLMDLLK